MDSRRREVSESAFEYLLAEILHNNVFVAAEEQMEDGTEPTHKLELLGYDVGYRYVESIAESRPVLTDPLDVIKFICKDVWTEVFKKQIDKLQTNHRGMFVLNDHNFRWLSRYASDDSSSHAAATNLLHFPCGLIRGALANLGHGAIVVADFNVLPGVSFNIKLKS